MSARRMGKIWNQGFTESGNITFYDMECCVPGSSGDQMKVWRGYWESAEPVGSGFTGESGTPMTDCGAWEG